MDYLSFYLLCGTIFQPDCVDDLAYAIMYEVTKLAYRVSEDDVTRARNQVKETPFSPAFSYSQM